MKNPWFFFSGLWMSNDNSTDFHHSVCLNVAFSSLLVFQNRKREKKGKKMCKVAFLPYARFLAPSVKSMFHLRMCVTVYMCARTNWPVYTHTYLSIRAQVPVRESFKCVVVSLKEYLSVHPLVDPSVQLSVCDAFIQINPNKWKRRHTKLTISIPTSP